MKATVELEPELYSAAEALARSQKKSIDQVLSELLRRALAPDAASQMISELERHNGFEVFPERSGPKATVETVQELCQQEGI